jgi:methionyl-tRNA synthetase
MNKFYITTAISYVNAPPHIGHTLEFVQADVLARYHRMKNDDTYFVTGTDEHGVKVFEAAEKAGMETQKFVDMNAEKFQALKGLLDLSYDDFIRTSSDRHKAGASKLWMKMVEKGDIYKGSYKGNYCVGCESFVPASNLTEEGFCPIHKTKPKELEEDNYFFKLSKYSDQIKKMIEKDEYHVVPESRKNEMLNIIGDEGLHDVSFSRPKEVLPWGVDVPGDDSQVMYVWGDAISNYITAVDYENEGDLYKKYWPADVHLIGKDILRFHAGIWPGMLLSAGVPLPKALYVHGFITSEGHKMSKTIGNVVDPLGYIEKYGADALRWFLMREIPTTDDGDFSHQRFIDVHNSELANGLGNLVNRVVMMTERYLEGKVPDGCEFSLEDEKNKMFDKYDKAFEGFDLKKACDVITEMVDLGNKYIDDKKPWAMVKEGTEGVDQVLYDLLCLLRDLAKLISPIIPETAEKILDQISEEIKPGALVKSGELLFQRIEED